MAASGQNGFNRVVLIAPPWPLYNRPSIQIGALKAYLKARFPDLAVEADHVFLDVAEAVGYPVYQAVSERAWPAESVYAALLFPDRQSRIGKVFRSGLSEAGLRSVDFDALVEQVHAATDRYIESVDWSGVGLVGLSVCLCQLTAGLYFVRRIRRQCPKAAIVAGGSILNGDCGSDLLHHFPEIDLVVEGEGERPLARIAAALREGRGPDEFPPIPGTASRHAAGETAPEFGHQLDSLSEIPPPDYDDYFDRLATFPADKRFFPSLPLEASRGCWWAGCAFCSLNTQWKGYRVKSPARIASEVDRLTARHHVLSVNFMDNLFPHKGADHAFRAIAGLGRDLALFAEIRATTPRHTLEAMRAAGVREVQIGIEALSTRLLKKINKGTTAITNLEAMKHCEELGLVNNSNLILQFPGSDEEDVAETLRTMEFAAPFRSLKTVRFWLGLGSPVCHYPERYGLTAVFNHRHYRALFPPEIAGSVCFMVQEYRGDLTRQRRLWRSVAERAARWEKDYRRLHEGPRFSPILGYADGGGFLIIRQRRANGEPMTHRLTGPSREIYLYCRRHRTFKNLLQHFPRLTEDRLRPFLDMMTDKKLMFAEKDQYLSLAITTRP